MSPAPLVVLAAIANGLAKLGPWLQAAKAYQAERKRLIAQHGQQAAEHMPDLAAVIEDAQRRLDAWDDDIDRREARLLALERERAGHTP